MVAVARIRCLVCQAARVDGKAGIIQDLARLDRLTAPDLGPLYSPYPVYCFIAAWGNRRNTIASKVVFAWKDLGCSVGGTLP